MLMFEALGEIAFPQKRSEDQKQTTER